MQRRAFLAGAAAVTAAGGLSGCSATPVWAPEEAVAAKRFRSGGPAHLTLFTMKSTDSDRGAHTGLLIDASQRVIFDPAGTFAHPTIPERNDVLFGATPAVEAFYTSYHARITFYVVTQKVFVPAGVAETVFQRALVAGPVPQAQCTRITSGLIAGLPGFETVRQTWFPDSLHDAFARLPGVETQVFRESDSDDKNLAVLQYDMQRAAN